MIGVFKEKKDTACHTMFLKEQKFVKKNSFDLSKIMFQNGLNPKTDIFVTFLRQTSQLQQQYVNINADSEPLKKYGGLGTRVVG